MQVPAGNGDRQYLAAARGGHQAAALIAAAHPFLGLVGDVMRIRQRPHLFVQVVGVYGAPVHKGYHRPIAQTAHLFLLRHPGQVARRGGLHRYRDVGPQGVGSGLAAKAAHLLLHRKGEADVLTLRRCLGNHVDVNFLLGKAVENFCNDLVICGQFGKGNCSMHYIRYDVLYQAVLERLQYWAKAVQQDEEKVLHKIQKVGNAERIREKKKKASALRKAENRQNEIDRLFAKMYEDRACEKITERNFIMLSGKYQKEQIELEQQITNLREELSKMEQDMIGAEKWIELIKEYSVPKELTAPLLNAMIEKILIHEATTNEENERIQEIEIYYRFIGKVD